MKISYDPEVDALSITFREATVTTKHLAEGIAADYDSEGRLAGLERRCRLSHGHERRSLCLKRRRAECDDHLHRHRFLAY